MSALGCGPDMAADLDSHRPFRETLRRLMAEHEMTFRPLAEKTGYSLAYVSNLATGRSEPTPENLERLAKAFGVHPRVFREYRVHMARERAVELEREVGLDKVLKALERLAK